MLAEHTSSQGEREALLHLCSPQGKASYAAKVATPQMSLLEVLDRYPQVRTGHLLLPCGVLLKLLICWCQQQVHIKRDSLTKARQVQSVTTLLADNDNLLCAGEAAASSTAGRTASPGSPPVLHRQLS